MDEKPQDLELLAAEYVLGTLEPAQRGQAETVLWIDPRFADAVEAWVYRLAPLADAVTPIEPPAAIWSGIVDTLGLPERPKQPAKSVQRADWRFGFLKWGGLAATAAAAALVIYLGAVSFLPAPAGSYVAVLDSGPANPAWLINVDAVEGEIKVRPLGGVATVQGSYELWHIAGEKARPKSLGLLNPTRDGTLSLDAAFATPEGQPGILAVSMEPAGGSTTGLPTGPVLFRGHLRRVSN